MPVFKIHRLKEQVYHQFRWAAHTAGATQVKHKDYELLGDVEGSGAYEVWASLKDSGRGLRVGDLLESEDGTLKICKYIGFEDARWVVPEAGSGLESAATALETSPGGANQEPQNG